MVYGKDSLSQCQWCSLCFVWWHHSLITAVTAFGLEGSDATPSNHARHPSRWSMHLHKHYASHATRCLWRRMNSYTPSAMRSKGARVVKRSTSYPSAA